MKLWDEAVLPGEKGTSVSAEFCRTTYDYGKVTKSCRSAVIIRACLLGKTKETGWYYYITHVFVACSLFCNHFHSKERQRWRYMSNIRLQILICNFLFLSYHDHSWPGVSNIVTMLVRLYCDEIKHLLFCGQNSFCSWKDYIRGISCMCQSRIQSKTNKC